MTQTRSETLAAAWLGRAALAVVLAGMYLPVLMTFVYSFNASRIGTVWTGFSLRWVSPAVPAARIVAGAGGQLRDRRGGQLDFRS